MAPAFGLVEAKGLFPYFVQCSNSVSRCSVCIPDVEAERETGK